MKYVEKRYWSIHSVRNACIKNDLFTMGDCEEYAAMLTEVSNIEPTVENIQHIAEIINKYSEDQNVANIMYILANESVTYCFE